MPRGVSGVLDEGGYVNTRSVSSNSTRRGTAAAARGIRRPLHSLTSWYRNRAVAAPVVAPPAEWNGRDVARLQARRQRLQRGRSRERSVVGAHGDSKEAPPRVPPQAMMNGNGKGGKGNNDREMDPLLSSGSEPTAMRRAPPIMKRQRHPIVKSPAAMQRRPPGGLLPNTPVAMQRIPPEIREHRRSILRNGVERVRIRSGGGDDDNAAKSEDDGDFSIDDDDVECNCCCIQIDATESRCWGEGAKNLCTIALWAIILLSAANRFFLHSSSHNHIRAKHIGGGGGGEGSNDSERQVPLPSPLPPPLRLLPLAPSPALLPPLPKPESVVQKKKLGVPVQPPTPSPLPPLPNPEIVVQKKESFARGSYPRVRSGGGLLGTG